MNLDDQLLKVKQDVENIKTRKIQIQTRLKTLEQEKEALLHECQLLNVDPTKIAEIVQQQEEKIQADLLEIQQMIGGINALRSQISIPKS